MLFRSELNNKPEILLTSNIIPTNNMPSDMIFNYKSYYEKAAGDISIVMLLCLLQSIEVIEVYVAGLDGYDEAESDNYYDSGLQFSTVSGINEQLINQLHHVLASENAIRLNFITQSRIDASINKNANIL